MFYRPKDKESKADLKKSKFHDSEGDHLTFLNVYEGWKKNNYSTVWCKENFIDERSMKKA